MLVVIAEDTAILRGGLIGLLEDEGHQVAAAVANAEALKTAVAEHKPDIVVADIRMPPTHTDEGVRAALELRAQNPRLPVLLFSQFTSMLDLIKPRLAEAGIPFVELRGDTQDRAAPVQAFESGQVPLFLISLKAGGRGLNLTSADTVIHYDPWWNPAVEHQATDRAFRIGQTRNVLVHKFVCRGTVEEKIDQMIETKQRLAGDFLSGSAELVLTEMNDDELLGLVALDLGAAMKEG